MAPLQVLLLCDNRLDTAATVKEHIESLVEFSGHAVRPVSIFGSLPERLILNRFDAVVIHYSLVLCSEQYVYSTARATLKEYSGLKVVFIQDEYRHVDATVAALKEIEADVLFTCVPEGEIDKVYSAESLPGLRKINTLTGFVPEHLCERDVLPFGERSVDVGYRSRRVPAWLGGLGQDKWRIGPRFLEDVPDYGLVCDISNSEEDRLYGDRWVKFLARCKAVLGTESGASVFDFDGSVQARVNTHIKHHPDVSFEELQRMYFAGLEGRIPLNQISPRCFEAAALRTLMIMYPGEYSGILTPYRHFIPLAKDHSNMAEVVSIFRNRERCEGIIQAAFEEVALNPRFTFRTFVDSFDREVSACWEAKNLPAAVPYSVTELQSDARPDLRTRRRRFQSRFVGTVYRVLFGKVLRFLSPERRDRIKLVLGSGLERLKGLLSAQGVS